MSLIHLPLRVGPDGRLARTDDDRQVVYALIRAMATAEIDRQRGSHPAWFEWFCLRHLFFVDTSRTEHPAIADAFTEAFRHLGLAWRVESVRTTKASPAADIGGEQEFEFMLATDGGEPVPTRVKV